MPLRSRHFRTRKFHPLIRRGDLQFIIMVSPQLKLIFPPPPSVFINAISVVSLISSAILGLSESIGKQNLQYSKFCQVSSQNSSSIKKIKLPSRLGMLFLYLPAFIAALISWLLFPHEIIRTLLLSSTLTLHFFKRVFEVSFFYLIKYIQTLAYT